MAMMGSVVSEKVAVGALAPLALVEWEQWEQEFPFRQTMFSKKIDQGLFSGALLPPKYHNTLEFGEVDLTMFI